MINSQNFKTILPDVSWSYAQSYIPLFDEILSEYSINTPLRKAYFLSQITHESGGFRYVKENLYYSSKALYSVFRKYFPTLKVADTYARSPERIANKVYANRLGNGNEESGDGWKYKGRGLIQLTGKSNYEQLSQSFDEDFVNNPDLLTIPKWAISSACWYWQKRNINKYADLDDIHMVTKLINGGFNGLENRQHFLDEYKKLFNL